MNTTPTRERGATRATWLLSTGIWLFVAFAANSLAMASEVGDDGMTGPLRWRPFHAPWELLHYVPFVPGTVWLWHLATRWLTRGRAFVGAAAASIFGLALVHVCWNQLRWGLQFGVHWGESPSPVVFGMLFWLSLHYGGVFAVATAVQARRLAVLRSAELTDARLRLLRSQLQPHFLFNTLQAIGSTAPRDGAAAARMTALLGDLLRQTLQERDSGFVSLAEEQELLRPYVEIQRMRFGDRLQLELDLPAELLAARVPDLLLQPLVENALQHGIEQKPGAGRVRVAARREGTDLVLDVADDGAGVVGANGVEPPFGTGLGATRGRLQTLFGARASLTLRANGLGGCTATLRLPYDEAVHAA